MLIANIFILSVALSLDAFGVAMGIGCGKNLKAKEALGLITSFALFQFLFVFLGGVVGNYIDANIINISTVFSGIVLILLGMLLLNEGRQNEEACIYYQLNFWKYAILGISVSIDALGVGFSVLYEHPLNILLLNSLIVGLVAAVSTSVSLKTVTYIKNFKLVETYSAYLGGTILIFFGLTLIL